MAKGITDATTNPARKLPKANTNTSTTIKAPSAKFFSTVPMALFTIFVRSKKASSTTPLGNCCWICATRAFTAPTTSLLLAPFSIITTAPATSPSAL